MATDRRTFLAGSMATTILAALDVGPALARAPQGGLVLGRPEPFSFDRLLGLARHLAGSAYNAPALPAASLVQSLDFDLVQKISFKPQDALWARGPGHFPVRFFPRNRFDNLPVAVHVLDGAYARQVVYRPDYFNFGDTGLATKLPSNIGFSGFRVMDGPRSNTDWLAFQGASYFRTAGAENQYGLSARGIAVDTALSTKEEFPRFSQFWIGEQPDEPHAVLVYALLEGPSLTGAYKIRSVYGPRGAVMEIEAQLFIRQDIRRLGIAPLTSMFWYGNTDYWKRTDWRPAVHDSDGLSLWTGSGERIWRPLNNPSTLQVNSFEDVNPRGFGLLQRDRAFANYEDDGAFYNRRPSVWVEPLEPWGPGVVQLVEIPTADEIHDNIVAYWLPKRAIKAGDHMKLSYRLYWQNHQPFRPKNVAEVVATRIGEGGIPGQPAQANARKFVIDFSGGPLSSMKRRYDLKPVVTSSRGTPTGLAVIPVRGTKIWRAFFDLSIEGKDPINLRCYIPLGTGALTETWLYQYFPSPL